MSEFKLEWNHWRVRYSAGPRNHPLINLHNCRHSLVTFLGRNMISYFACNRAIIGAKEERKNEYQISTT
jgi:hypothetical protein